MIRMIPQPIVNMETYEVVYEEWLCRPAQGTIAEYFGASDPRELWEREKRCIESALIQKATVPRLLNITLSSLPYFLESGYRWKGGLEIVEWGVTEDGMIAALPFLERVKKAGLEIWADDVDPVNWRWWKNCDVTGYKVSVNVLAEHPSFFRELKSFRKPVILEKIESPELMNWALANGLIYGQGFYFSRPMGETVCTEHPGSLKR